MAPRYQGKVLRHSLSAEVHHRQLCDDRSAFTGGGRGPSVTGTSEV